MLRLMMMTMIKMTVGKRNYIEMLGLWKYLVATLHEVAVRSRVCINSWVKVKCWFWTCIAV